MQIDFMWHQPKTMQETLDLYPSLDFVISMRLHANILSVVHGTSFYSISYGNKTRALLQELELSFIQDAKISVFPISHAILATHRSRRGGRVCHQSKNMIQYTKKFLIHLNLYSMDIKSLSKKLSVFGAKAAVVSNSMFEKAGKFTGEMLEKTADITFDKLKTTQFCIQNAEAFDEVK